MRRMQAAWPKNAFIKIPTPEVAQAVKESRKWLAEQRAKKAEQSLEAAADDEREAPF